MNRDDFLAEVRSWLGTPYMKDVCVKRGGTNCSRFVLDAVEKLSGVDGTHLKSKPHFVLLRKDPQAIVNFLESFCVQTTLDAIQPCDIAVITMGGIPCQAAVYVGNDKFVYSTKSLGVIEDYLPPNLEKRVTNVFRLAAFAGG
jgi:hypothetical protein